MLLRDRLDSGFGDIKIYQTTPLKKHAGILEDTEKVLSNLKELLKFVVDAHESFIGGCLPRARLQLTWSRKSLDQVDLWLVLFPQASPPNAPHGINRG